MRCTRPVLERCKTGHIEVVERPCGKCPACLANRAQEWTYRLFAESKLHANSCFVTLTYSDESLNRLYLSPSGLYSLSKKELQNLSSRIRFYGVGEYGGQTKRPHYHDIIFGLSPDDRPEIEKAWPYGFVTVGQVTPASMAYVARYCTKKLFSDSLDYEKEGVLPEFSLMSNRPGIGANAIDSAIRRNEDGQMFVWYQGKRCKVPQYFKNKVRTAVDVFVARYRGQLAADERKAEYECSCRSEFAEELQAEKNTLARRSNRQKV